MPELVIEARRAALSTGLDVRRILPFRLKRMVGPFIFLDHAGPIHLPAGKVSAMDVLPHPHIGLSTVTYLLDGKVTHRDSLGVEQIIVPGEVNWMTAGSGIAHSERFEDPAVLSQGGLEMLQTWVALPEQAEENKPEFYNYKPHALSAYTDAGVWMRLIAGNAYGLRNEVKTCSPLFYIHCELEAGARIDLPKEHAERAVYIVKGSIEVNGVAHVKAQMLVFGKGESPVLRAREKTTLMLLGGEPLGERFIWWNFVSSRKERIEQAKADWKAGRIILPPNDNQEFVPLPKDRSGPVSNTPPPPEPLS